MTAYAHVEESTTLRTTAKPNEPLRQDFSIPPNGRRLARDHADPRSGRLLYGFSGVSVGANVLKFETAAMAFGPAVQPSVEEYAATNDYQDLFKKEYALVASIQQDTCPFDPSGDEDTSCFAIVHMECKALELLSDESWLNRIAENTQCTLTSTEVLWAKNFPVDDSFLVGLAGVYGRNMKWAMSKVEKQTLAIHAAPAALLSLASLDYMSSIEVVKSTTINIVFVLFMLLPVVICFVGGIIAIWGRKSLVNIPDDGWKMFVMGKEYASVKTTDAPLAIGLKDAAIDESVMISAANTSDGSSDEKSKDASEEVALVKEKSEVDLEKQSKAEIQEKAKDDDDEWIDIGELEWEDHKGVILGVGQVKAEDAEGKEGAGNEKDENAVHFLLRELSSEEEENAMKGGFFFTKLHGAGMQELQTQEEEAIAKTSGGFNMKNPIGGLFCRTEKEGNAMNVAAGTGESWKSATSKAALYWTSGAMMFAGAVAIVAGSVLGAIGSDETEPDSGNFLIVSSLSNLLAGDSQQAQVPDNCFGRGNVLGDALQIYFEGTEDDKNVLMAAYGDIGDWCVDFVSDFSYLFAQRDLSDMDLSRWNTSSCQQFDYTFYGASVIPQGVEEWDVSSARTMIATFAEVRNFNNNTFERWQTSNVESFAFAFAGIDGGSSRSRRERKRNLVGHPTKHNEETSNTNTVYSGNPTKRATNDKARRTKGTRSGAARRNLKGSDAGEPPKRHHGRRVKGQSITGERLGIEEWDTRNLKSRK